MTIQTIGLICFVAATGSLAFEHVIIAIVLYFVGCALAMNRTKVDGLGDW